MAITWGNIIQGTKDSRQGKIGIETTVTSNGTSTSVTVKVYFASKYALTDTSNTWYYNEGTSATTSKGKKDIVHTHNTGSGWNSTNVTLLGTFTHSYSKTTTAQTKYFSAKMTGLENLGTSNVSSVKASITVPRLTTYTIVYHANGGSGSMANTVVTYGVTTATRTNTFTRAGHSFLGWHAYRHSDGLWYCKKSDGTTGWYAQGSIPSGWSMYLWSNGGTASKTTSVDGDTITLYAQWKANTYTVSFNANGGSGAPASVIKTYGYTLTLPTTKPTRSNYTFLGWSTSASGSKQYDAGGQFTTNANTTLYAVWQINYVKPRITNLKVTRCDSSGNADDGGSYAKVSFNWSVDKISPAYAVYWKATTSTAYSGGFNISLSGTSGTVSAIVKDSSGNHSFDTENAFDIKLNVSDANGYTSAFTTLNAVFIPIDCTEDGDCISFGEPAKDSESGVLRFAYKTVDIFPKENFKYKGGKFFGGNLLWQGNSVFTEASTITLPSKVSEQRNGLLLIFSRNGDYNFMSYYVPKELVASAPSGSHTFQLCTSLFDYIGQKTLYITDTTVKGHTDNDATGKNATSGITYHNEAFFLRYVYGV